MPRSPPRPTPRADPARPPTPPRPRPVHRFRRRAPAGRSTIWAAVCRHGLRPDGSTGPDCHHSRCSNTSQGRHPASRELLAGTHRHVRALVTGPPARSIAGSRRSSGTSRRTAPLRERWTPAWATAATQPASRRRRWSATCSSSDGVCPTSRTSFSLEVHTHSHAGGGWQTDYGSPVSVPAIPARRRISSTTSASGLVASMTTPLLGMSSLER